MRRPNLRFIVLAVSLICLFGLSTSFPLATVIVARGNLSTPTPLSSTEATAEAFAKGLIELWQDVTATTIGMTAEWTNKVELADINGDHLVDILFANGGDYERAGQPVASRVFLNQGAGQMFKEATQSVFGDTLMLARVIKVRDVNNDGYADIMVGTTFQTQSRLFLGDGTGKFTDVSATNLPQMEASIGDLEFGDVDGDGDLDIVLAAWGSGSPMKNKGGRTLLWLNDGMGHFTDATESQMPETLVRFSWELEFVDADNDYDLDILVSCKMCRGSFFFENDGTGKFSDVTEGRLPQFTNNYEFEAMDVNGDGYLDLTTINDGSRFGEHLFLNNKQGGFVDATNELLPPKVNIGFDDNVAMFMDFDSDGDADFLIGSLSGPDRLMINDGSGHFSAAFKVLNASMSEGTRGTLYMAVADLNSDHKLDIVEAQGEDPTAEDEHVYFGTKIQADTAAPIISLVESVSSAAAKQPILIRARVHDDKSPTMPHDWQSVMLKWTANGQTQETPLLWYGEYLWRGTITNPAAGTISYQVCATDAAGNSACSTAQEITVRE